MVMITLESRHLMKQTNLVVPFAISNGGLENLIFILNKFKFPTYKGSCPLAFGRFDSCYAGGVLKMLLSFTPDGLILINLISMSDADYVHGNKEIRHFLISATNEKMAQFIDELKGINSGARIDANFELLD
jgi:hypothetical protein